MSTQQPPTIPTMDFELISNCLTKIDSNLHKQALASFEQLKNDPNGWKLCVDHLLRRDNGGPIISETATFFCLQIIENYIKSRYDNDDPESQAALRRFIFSWFDLQGKPNITGGPSSNSTLNKFSYCVNSVFLIDFPKRRWITFFSDFLAACKTQEHQDLFLRILLQINADVADRDIPRTPKELERNKVIRDLMRETCLMELAQFWFSILSTFKERPAPLVCRCLDVIGAYISWIDISLITNDSVMANLFELFSHPSYRASVTDCFACILHKGMDPLSKVQLIEQFMSVDPIKVKFMQISNMTLSNDCDFDSEEGKFVVNMARLLNTVGIELIESYKKLKARVGTPQGTSMAQPSSSPQQQAPVAQSQQIHITPEEQNAIDFIGTALESKFTIMCQFLSSKNNWISLQVHPFAREYIQWVRHHRNASKSPQEIQQDSQQLTAVMLAIIIEKCKYPKDYDVWTEDRISDEEEHQFEEFRKSLKVLFDNLMLLSSGAVLNFICNQVVQPVLSTWQSQSLSFPDIEICLYYFYLIGENLNLVLEAKKIESLLQLLITSSVSSFSHPCTQTLYFDLILRYEKYLYSPSLSFLTPQILMSFLDERGFKNKNPHVRSKVALVFSKFIKTQLKSKGNEQIQSFSDEILKRLEDFLKMDITEDSLPGSADHASMINGHSLHNGSVTAASMLSTNSLFDEVQYKITEEDQLHVFESVAMLIVCNQNYDVIKKQNLLKNLLVEPVFAYFEMKCRNINEALLALGPNGPQLMAAYVASSSGIAPDDGTSTKLNVQMNGSYEPNMAKVQQIKYDCQKVAHAISLVACTSKAFSNQVTVKSLGAHVMYLNSFNHLIKALSLAVHEDFQYPIQAAVRQFLHRLIVCLDEKEIVPLLPSAIQQLFQLSGQHQVNNGKTLQEIVPLVNQVVSKFKHSWLFQRDLIPFFKQMFTPILSSFFEFIARPNLAIDERHSLQKSYYNFLSSLAQNNIMDVFSSCEIDVIEKICMTVLQGAVDFPDAPTQRSCFIILRKMVETFGKNPQEAVPGQVDPVAVAGLPPQAVQNPAIIAAFVGFIYKSIIPACFYAPVKGACDQMDGQLLNEALSCIRTVITVRGSAECISFLQNEFFPQNFPTFTQTNELLQAFLTDDQKSQKTLFKRFVQQFRQTAVVT